MPSETSPEDSQRSGANACSSSGGPKSSTPESPEDMIATTINQLLIVLDSPAAIMPALVRTVKDELVAWSRERDTSNISDTTAVQLIRELSDRNDDATYREAVKEIVSQCD